MVPIDDRFSLEGGDKHPLSDIKFPSSKFLRFLEDVRVADVPLDDLVLVLLSVLEFTPHVVGIYTEFLERFDKRDACTSGTSNRLDYP